MNFKTERTIIKLDANYFRNRQNRVRIPCLMSTSPQMVLNSSHMWMFRDKCQTFWQKSTRFTRWNSWPSTPRRKTTSNASTETNHSARCKRKKIPPRHKLPSTKVNLRELDNKLSSLFVTVYMATAAAAGTNIAATVYSAGTNHNSGGYILSRRTSIGRPSMRTPCIISTSSY